MTGSDDGSTERLLKSRMRKAARATRATTPAPVRGTVHRPNRFISTSKP